MDLLTLAPGVRHNLPDKSLPAISRAIVSTARDLCQRAHIWRVEVTQTMTAEGKVMALSGLPASAAIVDILSAEIAGEPWPTQRVAPFAETEVPVVYRQDLTAIGFTDTVPAGEVVKLRLSLSPRIGTTELPDNLVEDYYDALEMGTIGRFGPPGNNATAIYESLVSAARAKARGDGQPGRILFTKCHF
jgi:hypothetical protein